MRRYYDTNSIASSDFTLLVAIDGRGVRVDILQAEDLLAANRLVRIVEVVRAAVRVALDDRTDPPPRLRLVS